MKKIQSLLRGFMVVVVVACVLSGIALLFVESLRKEKERKEQQETVHKDATIGYPAGAAQLKDNQVYWVSVPLVEMTPAQTNYLAILQEIEIRASDYYKHSRTNRLFQLPWNLRQNGYYRISKFGTNNVSYDEIPGPSPQ